jgi:(p)ppGpp synthase/HD superfamily hydrolase
MLTKAFDEALLLASELHRVQTRKSTSVPYLSHLLAVAALVLEDGGDEEEAIAGLLHDALEDRGDAISAAAIEARFGARVRALVVECSDTPEEFAGGEKPPWRERKVNYLRHIIEAGVVNRVSLADKVHNVRSIVRDRRMVGESVWSRFTASKDGTLWYYEELAKAYRLAGARGFLIEELERLVRELKATEPPAPSGPALRPSGNE